MTCSSSLNSGSILKFELHFEFWDQELSNEVFIFTVRRLENRRPDMANQTNGTPAVPGAAVAINEISLRITKPLCLGSPHPITQTTALDEIFSDTQIPHRPGVGAFSGADHDRQQQAHVSCLPD